ncbi:hypothetical protein CBOM_07391 [Ceraceosorus bombacis]|uniref:Uncharacterized protein n=1 Tax=Ceraceosorus bombacis TaxID=401625 RepID=A0A0P1BB46_9BASI|nr:hypothetical protein CBOM_07391 [Ceraceosorus bombacis]
MRTSNHTVAHGEGPVSVQLNILHYVVIIFSRILLIVLPSCHSGDRARRQVADALSRRRRAFRPRRAQDQPLLRLLV